MITKKTKTKCPFKNYYCYYGRLCNEDVKTHPEKYNFDENVKQI